jgi:hypothetical protein
VQHRPIRQQSSHVASSLHGVLLDCELPRNPITSFAACCARAASLALMTSQYQWPSPLGMILNSTFPVLGMVRLSVCGETRRFACRRTPDGDTLPPFSVVGRQAYHWRYFFCG